MTLPEIDQVVKKLESESKALRKEIYQLAWYMRGALSVEDAFGMDISDRQIIAKIVEDNLKVTKDTKLPFF